MTIPTDDQFFLKTEKGKPDVAFLKNHFYREGRIKEEHALYILEKATRLLRAEPNVLTVDSPVTGATTAYTSASSSNPIPFSSLW
jgi:serine/threonine-protein phosphatase 2B catalytic subunit